MCRSHACHDDHRFEQEAPLGPLGRMNRGALDYVRRNYLRVTVLKRLDLTGGSATVIPKILRSMRANGSPTPNVQTDGDHTSFLSRLPGHPQAKSIEPASVVPEVTGEVAKSRLESPLAAKVLLCLRQEAAGKTRLATFLGHQTVSGELHKQIERLLAEELIEMTRPDQPNSRRQQYQLTRKGGAWLAAPGETEANS
jgi:ATP-dependent DNA helicase RecG